MTTLRNFYPSWVISASHAPNKDCAFIEDKCRKKITTDRYFISTDFKKHIKEISQIETLFPVVPIYDSFKKFGEEKARLRKEGNKSYSEF